VLVGQDGVQRPPLHFPRGGHLLAFLSCVETGLMPLGHLEPPLWYENGSGNWHFTVVIFVVVVVVTRPTAARNRTDPLSFPSATYRFYRAKLC